MPYITREDGERFIIPSYRDVLSAKKPALLKKEVLLLSTNYGEYITLQRKNAEQYEAAFSPDPGYLLGESIWHYFKRPRDLIYCEEIPNTSEVILVIVKSGSVYLDGSFAVDSIADELIVFRTQQSSFDVYIYGDIPLSEHPEEGKFSLDADLVRSFTVLTEPVFQTLPKNKAFQLRLVDAVLKSQGIGVVPVKRIIVVGVLLAIIWLGFTYISLFKKELPTVIVGAINPYQQYTDTLLSPAPNQELHSLNDAVTRLYTIPGWVPQTITYAKGVMMASVQSTGIKNNVLYAWAIQNGAMIQIQPAGIYVSMNVPTTDRSMANTISPLQQVIAELLDRLEYVIPGNNLTLGATLDKGRFSQTQLTINFSALTPTMFNLLADQLQGLPLVLDKSSFTVANGTLSGTIILKALGN